MSDDQDKLKLSLEPPKLFGRKKKSDAMGTSKSSTPAPAARRRPASDRPTDDETTPVEEVEAEEVEAEEVETEEPADDTAVIDVPPEPDAEPVPEPIATPEPAPEPKPAPVKKAARPRAKMAPPIEPEPVTATDHEDAAIVEHDDAPLLAMYPAAAITGAIVGAAMVLLTWLSLRGCEAVRGTSSCGGGPGFVLLVATFVICILVGSTLLKTFAIPDPGSSSFLAVGLVAVVALLFLIDALDHWSMIIVIPVLSVGSYLASVWVTKTFVEPGGGDAT